MTTPDWVNLSVVVGALFTGLSATMAVWAYLSARLQQQGDTFRELLFDCERDFETVYREFDQSGLIRTAGEVLAHSRTQALAKDVWAIRDHDETEVKELLEKHELDLKLAVLQAIAGSSGGQAAEYDAAFRLALHKLRPRYPVLHLFLTQVHSFMRNAVSAMQDPETYATLIKEGLGAMKTKGDLEEIRSSDGTLSFLFGIILSNMTRWVEEQRVNEALETTGKLMVIFVSHYRDRSDLSLWFLSRSERLSDADACDKPTYGDTFKALINLKRKHFDQTTYGEVSTLVGQLAATLPEGKNEAD